MTYKVSNLEIRAPELHGRTGVHGPASQADHTPRPDGCQAIVDFANLAMDDKRDWGGTT